MNIDQRRTAWTVGACAVLLVLTLWARLVGTVLIATCTFVLMIGTLRQLSPHLPERWRRAAALVMVVSIVGVVAALASVAIESRVDGGITPLAEMLADTLERLRGTLPQWLASKTPNSLEDLQHALAASLRSHAHNLQHWGHQLARGAAHGFVGVVVGILAALEAPLPSASPWLASVRGRGHNYVAAFSDIVLAQVRIALVNTVLTAAFLFALLPLAGIRVPLSGALVALSFATGLLPIVGNLVSNAAILLAALTVSPAAAAAALAFLLVIHKLEYVLNAHFVGRRTQVPASALLATMLGFEALFGVPGLVLAPIACAWAFHEARDAGLL